MAMTTYDENLVELIPNLKDRIVRLENLYLPEYVFEATNLSNNVVNKHTPVHIIPYMDGLGFIPADCSNSLRCDAFTIQDINSLEKGKLQSIGILPITNLNAGKIYYLGIKSITDNPLDNPGYIIQKIGIAVASNILDINIGDVLKLR